MIWLDNFCKKPQSFQVANIERGTFKAPLWTGRAVRKCRADVDMSLQYDNGAIVPAMPDNIFAQNDTLLHFYKMACEEKGMFLYDNSLTTTLQVRNVPVKPSPDKVHLRKHKTALVDRHDSLTTFFPSGIINKNIGSNRGFLHIMRKHYVENGQDIGECDRYSAFCVDIDIYNKILRVTFTHQRFTCIERRTVTMVHAGCDCFIMMIFH